MRTLHVRGYDAAGRFGERSYEFRVCSPPAEAGHWKLDGNADDDHDLITAPHDGYPSGGVTWVQSRWDAGGAEASYTMTVGPTALMPTDAVLALTGDDQPQQIDLPFAFPYFGQSYSQAWVDTNGYVDFEESGHSEPANGPLPVPDSPNLAVYPYWSDLIVDATSSVRTGLAGAAPDRTFVVEWRNVRFYVDDTKRVTFQAQLREDGRVSFAYGDIAAGDPVETGGSTTVGIENPTGTTALVYADREQVLVDGTGPTFTPTGYVPPPYPDGYYEARFDGTGEINTAGPVLATGVIPDTSQRRSFAVAAWVKVTDTTGYRTAVSQQGTNKSLFELGYQAGTWNNYCFTMFPTDNSTSAGERACATAPVVVGEWVHLAGVYDGVAGTMTLYVHHKDQDGFLDPSKTEIITKAFTSVWDATGAFTIGRALTGASFIGDVDEVWAWQRAPEQFEIEFYAAN